MTPYLATEEVLLFLIAYLHQEKLAHGTIKSYLAAIRYGQIQCGMGNLAIHSMPQVEYVLKGAKKATPVSMRRRLPITPPILATMKRVWKCDPNPRNAKMLWAASCLCFFGFLQSGEIVCPSESMFDPPSHLCFGDVKGDNRSTPSAIQVTIKASKTGALPPRGNPPHWGCAWPLVPGSSSTQLHGGQGKLIGSTVYMGGQSVPHQRPFCEGRPGSPLGSRLHGQGLRRPQF